MIDKVIGRFETRYLQILNEQGEIDPAFPPPPDQEIKKLFETIVLVRTFNQRALSLQREGRIGTYASIYGQEASQVASAFALSKDDWVFPSFRETGVFITLGFPMWMLLRYWAGDERGMKIPPQLNIFPMSVPVGTQIPHAVGAGMAMNLKNDNKAAVAYFGDGGSSRGDFHEGLNLAGVFKVPVIFICQNNQWAISTPRQRQTAAETIAQKAVAYGFDGVQVDGNDVFAVYRAAQDALKKAKDGNGPTLIECFTYRLDDHTTSDDARLYRSMEEVEAWKEKEPLIRLRLFMDSKGLWTEDYEKEVLSISAEKVDKAIEEEEIVSPSEPSDMIRYTSATLTARQLKELKDLGWLK
ncbi:MAG: pyruvate dehydrogenase (acetyl-transferring) E1 component subunit alpha [Deltaproteobacteria bacterium]|nr:pyruvate dehydrogenase (acetyl-transferring) E1 component subunit alpha [Deltaproteobacteria bacterium]